MATRNGQAYLDEDERRLIGPFLTGSPSRSGEWRAYCPHCENPGSSNSPSASFNFRSGVWNCFKCERGGKIPALIRHLIKNGPGQEEAGAAVIDMKSRKRVAPAARLPTPQNLANWHATLLASPNSMRVLRDRRGWTLETIKRFQIGLSSTAKRYTIPVFGRDGSTLLAVKLYRPTAKRPVPKMIFWTPDDGGDDKYETTLFNAAALDTAEDIILCEGEPDCIINSQNGIPTVTHTAGVGGFQGEWAAEFAGKNVYIIPDDDAAGTTGAIRTARILEDFAAAVYIVHLKTGIKSGDLTDWYVSLKKTSGHLRELCEEAEPFSVKEQTHDVPTKGKPVSLVESQNPDSNGEPLELVVAIAGKQSPPYLAPKLAIAECDRKKGERCKVCPMFRYEGKRELTPAQDDSQLLRFVGANDQYKKRVLVDLAGALCDDHITFDIIGEWSLEELVVVQSVGHRTEEAQQPMNRKVFSVGTYSTPVNSTVRLVGRQLADPRDSRGIFHGWHVEPVDVDIDKFKMTPKLRDSLSVFQRARGQTSLAKSIEIARDMADNVTGIKGRDLLHVAYDLVWHSVQYYDFGGKRVVKGWLEAIAIGDTRTGKSEAAEALARHYNSGLIKSCEGATFAGLVGGATQMPQGRGWMITWGTIPLHDRRLVVLDELSGIKDKDIIEQMSSIRSSGIAQLTKIVQEQTSARTRLFWLSNDPDGKRMAETNGMDAIQRLVKNPEDVARFDFALALSNSDVPSSLINSGAKLGTPKYSSELCTQLVLWAWSRRPDQVRWVRDAESRIIRAAEDVGARYVSTPPLVQVENIRLKLARLAVAFAARTFSTNTAGNLLLVQPEHVSSAVAFLDAVYGTEVMGYARHSRRTLSHRAESQANKRRVKRWLASRRGVLDALRVVGTDKFRLRDFEEFGSLGEDLDPRTLVHQLIDWRMIRRLTGDRGYIVAEPALIELLKELEDQGL